MRLTYCLLFISLVTSTLLHAHGLLMTVEREDGRIVGTAYFTNGEKAAAQAVELIDLDSPGAKPVNAVTDSSGEFQFSAIASHRYQVSVFGEEGHEVQMELVAGEKSRPRLIEANANVDESSFGLPAWAVIGSLLLLSLIPAFFKRKQQVN